jgi:hypothetical protein
MYYNTQYQLMFFKSRDRDLSAKKRTQYYDNKNYDIGFFLAKIYTA